jgi:ribosome-associated protein
LNNSLQNIEFELDKYSEYIELIKLLKALNIAESGAHAKEMVDAGIVEVNGQVEHRKRAKLRSGDVVKAFSFKITVKQS